VDDLVLRHVEGETFKITIRAAQRSLVPLPLIKRGSIDELCSFLGGALRALAGIRFDDEEVAQLRRMMVETARKDDELVRR
jgi:hypothetical protein